MRPSGLCYLCGNPLSGATNADHVPPRRFYPKARRGEYRNLLTLRTHTPCNSTYKRDEEYFVTALLPIYRGTVAMDAALDDLSRTLVDPRGRGLGMSVLAEFTDRPSGLYLPGDMMIKRIDSPRASRVVWKIIRGLFFNETGSVLSERTPHQVRIFGPQEGMPAAERDLFARWLGRGLHKDILDYGYVVLPHPDRSLCIWMMQLWGRMQILVKVHHTSCECQQCELARAVPTPV